MPFISVGRGAERVDSAADASVAPAVDPSRGFTRGGVGFCWCCVLVCCSWGGGVVFSWLQRNMCFQVLPKPEGCFCFGDKDNVRLAFLILNGTFWGRI